MDRLTDIALWMRFALALVLLGLLAYALFAAETVLDSLVEALKVLATMAVTWFFGSSKGSSDKDRVALHK